MRIWPDADGTAIRRYLRQLRLRNPITTKVYRCVLSGFQHFVAQHQLTAGVSQQVITAWLRERAKHWPFHMVRHRACMVDRFLQFLASKGLISDNPFAQLRGQYGQRWCTPVVRALLAAAPEEALEALRPLPQFASCLGELMRNHIELMRAMGFRYHTQAERLLRFDRFLQGRPDLTDEPLAVSLEQWAASCPTLEHALVCQQVGRALAKAWRRIDSNVALPPADPRLLREVKQRRRQPYIFTEPEICRLLDTAMQFPSPRAPLRPAALYMMLVLAYCAGLRIGEIVRLDLADVDLETGEIAIRETKFFKSRLLPLADSAVTALREYLELRKRMGAPQEGASALFWHDQSGKRYSTLVAGRMLACLLCRAGLKPQRGRVGPRVHDLRHAFVVNRMLAWYREGINPQSRLPYLATYLGHKDINSTLIYLTITQELLQQAAERFRSFGAHCLHAGEGAPQ
jgi:integrase/recombinase XerD